MGCMLIPTIRASIEQPNQVPSEGPLRSDHALGPEGQYTHAQAAFGSAAAWEIAASTVTST